jgi:DNA polymerase III epsilon subunit-like protein
MTELTENNQMIENSLTVLPIRRKRRILVFDVETTGLIPKIDPLTKKQLPLEEMPFIIQISFIVFNLYECIIERTYNAYIRIKTPEKITEEITNLTGITREKCETEGVLMKDALLEFYNEYIQSDYIIAHNIQFDRRMIMIEIERNYAEIEHSAKHILNIFNPLFCKLKGIENYCTMMSSLHICNIMIESKKNKENKYKKFPKLTELYFCLFQMNPDNLHNALVDTLVCLRCFLKIKMNQEIHPKKYDSMLKAVMRMV